MHTLSLHDALPISFYINNIKKKYYKYNNSNILCDKNYIKEINQELFDRLIKPIYLFLIAIISCFLLTKYKETHKYKLHKYYIFAFGIIIILFSEISVNYAGKNSLNTIMFYFMPFILCIFTYLILRNKLIFKKN